MFRRRSKRDTRRTRSRSRAEPACRLTGVLALCVLTACDSGEQPDPPPTGLRLRVAHLSDYLWTDRDGDRQPDEFKPAAECAALLRELSRHPADVWVIRGIGSSNSLQRLHGELSAEADVSMQCFYAPGETVFHGVGFLSTVPFEHTRELSHLRFTVRDLPGQPLAGAVRIRHPDLDPFWLWNVEWPGPEADYERRRNEARQLVQVVKRQLRAGEPLLISLHNREEDNSPMTRMLREAGLHQVRVTDDRGDAWTHRSPGGTRFRRDQELWASTPLPFRIAEARILDSPDLRTAGEFRHQWLRLLPADNPGLKD